MSLESWNANVACKDASSQTPSANYPENEMLDLLLRKIAALQKTYVMMKSLPPLEKPHYWQTHVIESDNSESKVLRIGPNGTEITKKQFDQIDWKSFKTATRQLCHFVFDKDTLATHSLSGKYYEQQSAHIKKQLDLFIVDDIVWFIQQMLSARSTDIRVIISQTCTSEYRALKKKSETAQSELEKQFLSGQ